MTYPVATAISRVRRLLEDYPYETVNSSDPGTAVAGDIDTFTVPDGTKWAEGDVLEFQDNGELCYVRSIATNTLTVVRGYDGSTATAAHAVNTRVCKNPVFAYQWILDTYKNTIKSLWPYVWKKVSTTATPVNGTFWYSLPAEWMQLSSVTQLYANSKKVGYYGPNGDRPCDIRRDLPTSFLATGVGLHIPQGFFHESNTIFVVGIAPITDTVAANAFSDIEPIGVDVECLAHGTASELLNAKEVKRVTQDDVTQSDQSVAPLRRAQTGQMLFAKFERELNNWHHYLMESTPPMTRWY